MGTEVRWQESEVKNKGRSWWPVSEKGTVGVSRVPAPALQNSWLGLLLRRWATDLINVKDGESAMHISIQAEENCLQVVDELLAKWQQLKDIVVAQNSNAEEVQAQIEEERKKFLAVDR